METTKKPIPYIPEELMEEIISRLPVKALMKFRSVYRSWNNLISESRFCKSHLKKSMINHNHTKIMHLKKCHLNLLCDINGRPIRKGSKFCLSLLAYCNGLFCINTGEDVFLWNPSTKQTRKIPTSRIELEFPSDDSIAEVFFGLGHHLASDDYKLVRISCGREVHFETDVQIYSRNTGTWRRIQDFPDKYPSFEPGVFVNGCLHWLIWRWKTNKVVVLNLDNESYDMISLPELGRLVVYLNIGSLDEKLIGFYLCLDDNTFNMFVLKEHGRSESWTRIIKIKVNNVRHFYSNMKPICHLKPAKILFHLGLNKLFTLDVEENRSSNICSPFVLEEWGIGQILIRPSCNKLVTFDVEEKQCTKWSVREMVTFGFVETLVSPNAPSL